MTSPISPTHTAKPRSWRRIALWLAAILLLALSVMFLLHLLLPRNFKATGEQLTLHLTGGPQVVPYYCQTPQPKGIMILGTGDGGWSYWEENTARHLSEQGYAVGGWDCRKFADSRKYELAQLCEGFREAYAAVLKRSGATADTPVWYVGWSTGSEQAVAAATDPDRPASLKGLLLAAPGDRGRYGITTQDLLGIPPSGEGTFGLEDMGHLLRGVPVVQFVAGLDPLDDSDWLDSYPGPKKLVHLSGMLHDMGGAGPTFQHELDLAIQWTQHPQP